MRTQTRPQWAFNSLRHAPGHHPVQGEPRFPACHPPHGHDYGMAGLCWMLMCDARRARHQQSAPSCSKRKWVYATGEISPSASVSVTTMKRAASSASCFRCQEAQPVSATQVSGSASHQKKHCSGSRLIRASVMACSAPAPRPQVDRKASGWRLVSALRAEPRPQQESKLSSDHLRLGSAPNKCHQ